MELTEISFFFQYYGSGTIMYEYLHKEQNMDTLCPGPGTKAA